MHKAAAAAAAEERARERHAVFVLKSLRALGGLDGLAKVLLGLPRAGLPWLPKAGCLTPEETGAKAFEVADPFRRLGPSAQAAQVAMAAQAVEGGTQEEAGGAEAGPGLHAQMCGAVSEALLSSNTADLERLLAGAPWDGEGGSQTATRVKAAESASCSPRFRAAFLLALFSPPGLNLGGRGHRARARVRCSLRRCERGFDLGKSRAEWMRGRRAEIQRSQSTAYLVTAYPVCVNSQHPCIYSCASVLSPMHTDT